MKEKQQRLAEGGAVMSLACALVGAACLAPAPLRAEMMIARDSGKAYQQNPHAGVRHVLLYDQAPGHDVGRAALRASLARLAMKYGFRLDTSRAPIGYITTPVLSGVDVVVFSQGDGDVLSSEASTTAMERFVYQQGGGMLMVHDAAAFIPCPGTSTGGGGSDLAHPDCRFLARAAARQYHGSTTPGTPARLYVDSVTAGSVPPHGSLGAPGGVGPVPPASTYSHGISSPETRSIFTGIPRMVESHPGEWFHVVSSPRLVDVMTRSISNLGGENHGEGRVNVLLSVDERSHDFGNRRLGDHPIAWTRKMGHGLAGVNTLGHADVYAHSDSVLEKFNWRLMRYLARDFVGCTDPTYAEFNPEASVTVLSPGFDDPAPCKTPVSLRPGAKGDAADFRVESRDGKITLGFPGTNAARVNVTDVGGRQAYAHEGASGQTSLVISGLRPGIYFVRVAIPGFGARTVRVNLL